MLNALNLVPFTAVPLTFLSSRPEGEILFYSGLRSLTFVTTGIVPLPFRLAIKQLFKFVPYKLVEMTILAFLVSISQLIEKDNSYNKNKNLTISLRAPLLILGCAG